jgi:hypothetical protein
MQTKVYFIVGKKLMPSFLRPLALHMFLSGEYPHHNILHLSAPISKTEISYITLINTPV